MVFAWSEPTVWYLFCGWAFKKHILKRKRQFCNQNLSTIKRKFRNQNYLRSRRKRKFRNQIFYSLKRQRKFRNLSF